MAFSFRKMISNMGYFKTSEDETVSPDPGISEEQSSSKKRRHSSSQNAELNPPKFEKTEINIDGCKFAATQYVSIEKPHSIKYFTAAPDPLTSEPTVECIKRQTKKLRLENQTSMISNLEETSEAVTDGLVFCEKFKKSLESLHLFTDNDDLESISEHSNSGLSVDSNDGVLLRSSERYKLCRKVSNESFCQQGNELLEDSSSLCSFSDIEFDRTDEGRQTLVLSYQLKLEKLENAFKKLLNNLKFHIEETKLFQCKSFLTTLPGTDVATIPKILNDITNIQDMQESKNGAWNVLLENDDVIAKAKFQKQLANIAKLIQNFSQAYLYENQHFALSKKNSFSHKKLKINKKKTTKKLDNFPDFHDDMQNLFSDKDAKPTPIEKSPIQKENFTEKPIYMIKSPIHHDTKNEDTKCHHCRNFLRMNSSPKSTDSGLNTRPPSTQMSYAETIASSIADFSLDNSTMTSYSESLDNILNYNSYADETVYTSILEKPGMERIAFYMQVHKITMTAGPDNKTNIVFTCACCSSIMSDEHYLLKHILSQSHCEKLHFAYKTEYIKKCLETKSELKPSTVLNPMTMYRDVNKIVCFGDGAFACTLCFEMLIIGESYVMQHMNTQQHVEKKAMLGDLFNS